MALDNLLSPIKLGDLEILNRVAMAPMGMGEPLYSPDETWPKRVIRYYEERAIGGAGLIITGFNRVHEKLACVPNVGIYDDRFIPSHTELVEKIHKYGSKIIHQIALMGGKFGREGPSSIYSLNYFERPRELTTEEIDGLVQSFIDAAGRGIKAGYDGVEVHGGHTYFIGAMMSPALNKRTDKYGGSFEKRMKFVTDVINGIKENYPGHPIGFKFSAWEELPGGVDIELGQRIAKYIADLGIAYLHVSSTAATLEIYSKYPSCPPLYIPRNTLMPLAEEIKKICPDTVIMATGSITVPEEAEEFITAGKCDMVALGRTVFADPHWVNNARDGKPVNPCIRCNVCYSNLFNVKELECTMNPYLLHEASQELPTPARTKDVMVIGAGPSGIRCALTASKRGHKVTLYEKKPYIGGMLYPGSQPDCKKDVARAIDYFKEELDLSNVTLKLETEVTPEIIEEKSPEALVIATGTGPVMPDIEGIDKPHVSSAVEVLRDISGFSGSKAVVVGGGDVGCEAACHLADNGYEVTVVEMLPDILQDAVMREVKMHMLHLLEEKNIRVMTDTSLTRIIDEGIEVMLPNGRLGGLDADIVAIAMNLESDSKLLKDMAMKAEEVFIIGDAASLGRIKEAIVAGEEAGRKL